ncbi:RNA-binding protein [Brevundimonas sp.]|uniref:RNA-binding protein n=1 Tax=Brevundimonas sp. TaxID=1871086 RepID=UPI002BD80878|nr:RNA-binding protein [Brevundimonas sp.]HWQ85777.1 RNA-binding protein [Brevundimonas sp.]
MKPPVFVYLDETPGETRAIIRDEVGYQYFLTQFEDDIPQYRLGARSVGRVRRIEPDLKGVFIDLGEEGGGDAFLPSQGGQRLHEGEKVGVEVVSERREMKGVTLKLLGKADGEPRLLTPGPTVTEWLGRLAPGVEPVEGVRAIEAGWDALREADGQPFLGGDVSVTVERTRALIAVDFDYRPLPGRRASPQDRLEANRKGLRRAAQTIRLRSLGGLAAIDLIGVGQDGGAILKAAKAAFGNDPGIVYGPVNRFGVLMIALPWRFTPLAERLYRGSQVYWPHRAAIEVTRKLRHALLSDTTTARVTARCTRQVAELAAPLVARLGPRAHLKGDDSLRTSEHVIEAE